MKAIGEMLDEAARRAAATRSSPTSSTETPAAAVEAPSGDGRPGCPSCGGVGWLRREGPLGHPDFGRAFPCDCIRADLAERRLAGARRASNMATLGRMTFENFQVTAAGNTPQSMASLKQAFEATSDFARRPEGWLVLSGGYGSGKTHLAAAIVNQRLADGESALFVVVPDLLDHLRAAYAPSAPEAYDERFDAVRSAPLLVLDDLGAEAHSAWAAEKLFQLLNYRYNARLPTVFTTNQPLEDLDERLRSRLGEMGFVRTVELQALDYRGGLHGDRSSLSSLGLYTDCRFQTWDPRTGELPPEDRENLLRAFQAARDFAASAQGWLVLQGGPGCGKTHLAAAIANHWVAEGGMAMFVVVPDLLDHLRAAFSPQSRSNYDKRFEEVRAAPLLVLDDLGTENATPWAKEKLFQILNHRYAARLPTVITIAGHEGEPWKRIDERLVSRINDRRRCKVVGIKAPPYGGPAEVPRRKPAGRR